MTTAGSNAPSSPPTTSSTAEAAMVAKPQQEHTWLQKLVGEWTIETEFVSEPGKPMEKSRGTETVKPVGELWIVGEGQGEMPGGGTAQMMITLGFDPRRNRFVGTWLGSMMAHLWTYDGELDEAGRVLTLHAEGPSFAGDGTLAQYRDVIEIKSPDHRILTSSMQGADGTWTQFMTAHYRRRK